MITRGWTVINIKAGHYDKRAESCASSKWVNLRSSDHWDDTTIKIDVRHESLSRIVALVKSNTENISPWYAVKSTKISELVKSSKIFLHDSTSTMILTHELAWDSTADKSPSLTDKLVLLEKSTRRPESCDTDDSYQRANSFSPTPVRDNRSIEIEKWKLNLTNLYMNDGLGYYITMRVYGVIRAIWWHQWPPCQ